LPKFCFSKKTLIIEIAHLGVGLFGREGTQAARCSDFAIHKFKYEIFRLFFEILKF
jgi:magnesium-transporting ATPase (P-type)